HEEGGWVYMDTATGVITTRRAPAGARAVLDLTAPEIVPGFVVVATFHTHPNPAAEGWDPGPSPGDEQSAQILGVPCLIRAEDGIYTTGPDARRGGLAADQAIRHEGVQTPDFVKEHVTWPIRRPAFP